MGKNVNFSFAFSNGGIYYPGQTVQGEVIVDVQQEVKIRGLLLTFCGEANVHWTESHDSGDGTSYTEHYSSHEQYFSMAWPCLSPPPGIESMIIQPGSYRYPFTFQIPMGCPSSFEGSIGQVRYYVKANMDRPWAFDETATAIFSVANLIDLNREPEAMNAANAEDHKTLCCLCCASGPISVKNYLPKLGFVPGETIPIKAEILNHSNRDGQFFMQLVQSVLYIARRKTNTIAKVIGQTARRNVGKGDSEYWSGEHITVPPLPGSRLDGCGIINISYFWQLVYDPSGPALALRVPINIIIGGIPHVSSTQQYGAPGNFGGGPSAPPENLFQPSFSSFTPNPAFQQEQTHNDNRVHPGGDDQQTFAPQYPYYNWNSNDSNFKPTKS